MSTTSFATRVRFSTTKGVDITDRLARPTPRHGTQRSGGVAVDGKLVHAGGLPDATKLEQWLTD